MFQQPAEQLVVFESHASRRSAKRLGYLMEGHLLDDCGAKLCRIDFLIITKHELEYGGISSVYGVADRETRPLSSMVDQVVDCIQRSLRQSELQISIQFFLV